MSWQTDHALESCKKALAGDKEAEKLLRNTLKAVAEGPDVPVHIIVDLMKRAIHLQNNFHEAN